MQSTPLACSIGVTFFCSVGAPAPVYFGIRYAADIIIIANIINISINANPDLLFNFIAIFTFCFQHEIDAVHILQGFHPQQIFQ